MSADFHRFQSIRAICEDQTDSTEVSLIYANRSEADILLRDQLDRFAQENPNTFSVYYTLDNAPPGWKFGVGFVSKEMLQAKLPSESNGKFN